MKKAIIILGVILLSIPTVFAQSDKALEVRNEKAELKLSKEEKDLIKTERKAKHELTKDKRKFKKDKKPKGDKEIIQAPIPVSKPDSRTVVKPSTKPVLKPSTKPEVKPTTKPISKPAPDSKPATKPVEKPTAPVVKPARKANMDKPVVIPATISDEKTETDKLAKPKIVKKFKKTKKK